METTEQQPKAKGYKADLAQGRVLNPLEAVVKNASEGKAVTSFTFPNSFQVHDPLLVKEALGKLHKVLVEDPHPYRRVAPAMTPEGRETMLLRGASESADLAPLLAFARERTQVWLQNEPRGETTDVFPGLAHLSLDIMGKALFGLEMGALSPEFFQANMEHEDFLAMMRRGRADVRNSEKVREAGRAAMGRQQAIAKQVLQARRKVADFELERVEGAMPIPMAVVRTFLNAYAGVATTLSWVAVLLGEHPEFLESCAEEKGARSFVLETLRLYPAAWMMSRTATQDVVVGDVTVPRGGQVFVCPFSIHRDPNLWERALEFDPSRFSNDEFGGAGPHAYVPFGVGPHKCPGMRFALDVLTSVVSEMSSRVSFQKVGVEITPFPRVALRPEPGALVQILSK